MSTAPRRRLLTEEEYLLVERQAEQKSEFARGEMFAMAGASEAHETIAGNCFGLLWQELSKRGCGVFKSEMKVRIPASGRYTYPDVVAMCGERKFADQRKDILLNPTLIIEVLSESTSAYDRGDKSRDYRTLDSLRELLIIEQDQPLIECFVRQSNDTWTLSAIRGREASIELPSVACTLRTCEIYAGIDFASPQRPTLRVAGESDD